MTLVEVNQVIDTLGDALEWLARYAGGTVPASTDAQYTEWVSWLSESQEDAAERGNWGRLLEPKDDFTITANEKETVLPDNFHKRTGIYVLDVNGIDWNQPNNEDGQRLLVRKRSDGKWVVRYIGFTPTETVTATLWYFRHPGKLAAEADKFMLDGKMCCHGALTEYSRQAGELGSLDDSRAEYNNRFEENLSNEVLPTPQELTSWIPYHKHLNQPSIERSYYSRGRRRV